MTMTENKQVSVPRSERDQVERTDNQQQALDAILDWLQRRHAPQELTLGGLAGTGKTTLIRLLLHEHWRWLSDHWKTPGVAALSGKAVSVLKSKGVLAQTIHSMIYDVVRTSRGRRFVLKDEVPHDFVVVDEASMVNRRLYEDLKKRVSRILWVGDMGQLEPIGDDPNLMKNPDLQLTEIHRQAICSDIIRFAHHVRFGGHPSTFVPTPGQGEVIISAGPDLFYEKLLTADQIICGIHRTRKATNAEVRRQRGFEEVVEPDDRLICLANNRYYAVHNGLVGRVKEVHRLGADFVEVNMHIDDGEKGDRELDLTLDRHQFDRMKETDKKLLWDREDVTAWDYGYCINCHKAQGSEFNRVLVAEEPKPSWDMNRWRYTAITRAAKGLIYCY